MASTPQFPPPTSFVPPVPLVAGHSDDPSNDHGQALMQMAPNPDSETVHRDFEVTGPVALLPVELDVAIPVRNFRVRNLLSLEPGQLIETQWHHGEDVPLAAADVQLAWSEFEVIDTDLAVRITRLP